MIARPAPPKIKICGLTSAEDALACVRLGVDWIGLNFHRPSPRYVAPERASEIIEAVSGRAATVGVFVDWPAAEVSRLAERLGLGIVQLHGAEPPEDLLHLGRFQVVRAFRLATAADWDGVSDYLKRAEALGRAPDAVLIDAHVAGQPGGTGTAIADAVLESAPRWPRLVLAGGLTPENVAERVARARPWMVDVASGVESSPGRKCPERMAEFVRAARSAARSGSSSTLTSSAMFAGRPPSDGP